MKNRDRAPDLIEQHLEHESAAEAPLRCGDNIPGWMRHTHRPRCSRPAPSVHPAAALGPTLGPIALPLGGALGSLGSGSLRGTGGGGGSAGKGVGAADAMASTEKAQFGRNQGRNDERGGSLEAYLRAGGKRARRRASGAVGISVTIRNTNPHDERALGQIPFPSSTASEKMSILAARITPLM